MWIVNSYTVKVLVWLSAASMPCDMLLAGTCGCDGQNTSNTQCNSAQLSPATNCCCHSGTVCKCCHRANNVKQSACCKNKTGNANTARDGFSPVCFCSGGRVPAPQIPLSDSSLAKQLAGHAWVNIAPAAVVGLPSPSLSFIGNCLSLPATPLERLSNICRLII
jgi:hypothetical protein